MFLRKRRADNRGLSLIELVCSVAILSIVTATVGGAMVVASKSYQRGTQETSLQQEAQFTVNAIENLIIDATDKVTFDGSKLRIVNSDCIYEIEYAGDTLTYGQYAIGPDNSNGASMLPEGTDTTLAKNVTSFNAITTDFATSRNLKLEIGMKRGSSTYFSAYNVTSRNKPVSDESFLPSATLFVQDVLAEPNEEVHIPITVSPRHGATDGFNSSWVAEEDGRNLNGVYPLTTTQWTEEKFTVGANETGGSDGKLTLHVATRANDSGTPLDEKDANIKIRRVSGFNSSTPSKTTGEEYKRGATYTVDINVVGTNLDKTLEESQTAYDNIDPYSTNFVPNSEYVENGHFNYDPDTHTYTYTFTLKQDLPVNTPVDIIEIRSNHADGRNKTSTPYTHTPGKVTMTAVSSGPIRLYDDNIARGADNVFQDTYTYPAGATIERQIRYRQAVAYDAAGNITSYGPWSVWKKMDEAGKNDPLEVFATYDPETESGTKKTLPNASYIRPNDLKDMDYWYDYQIQIDCTYTLDGRRYPSDAERGDDTVLYADFRSTFPVDKMAVPFRNIKVNGTVVKNLVGRDTSVNTATDPIIVRPGEECRLDYNWTHPYSQDLLIGTNKDKVSEYLEMKLYKQNAAGGWDNFSGIQQDNKGVTLRVDQNAIVNHQLDDGHILKAVFQYKADKSSPIEYADVANDGQGVIYFKVVK